MNKNFIYIFIFALFINSFFINNVKAYKGKKSEEHENDINQERKKKPIKIINKDIYTYTQNSTYSNLETYGAKKITMPIAAIFEGSQSCYLSCLTSKTENAILTHNNNEYVAGMLQVKGLYYKSQCQPYGFEGLDIRTNSYLMAKCEMFFNICQQDQCYISTNTERFYDLK